MSKTRRKNTAEKKGGGLIRGILAGIIAAAVLLGVYALLISRAAVSTEHAGPVVAVINFMSAVICGVFSSAATGEGRGKRSLTSGAIYAVLILTAAAAVDASLLNTASVIRIVVCSISGALLGGILRLGKSNKKRRKNYKVKN